MQDLLQELDFHREVAELLFTQAATEFVMEKGKFPQEWESQIRLFIGEYTHLINEVGVLDDAGPTIPYVILAALTKTINLGGHSVAEGIMNNVKTAMNHGNDIAAISILTTMVFGAYAQLYGETHDANSISPAR